MRRFTRIHLLVLDSLGVGGDPRAADFGDEGANTFAHIATACGGLAIPTMERFGFGNVCQIHGAPPAAVPAAWMGKMREASNAKDTMAGHWELMGLWTEQPFRTYPEGFPPVLVDEIEKRTGRKVLGNKTASGTEIIEELGPEHMASGALIVYTSADSVLQIAAHENIIPIEEQYRICRICRELTLGEPYNIGRIIARPFVGTPGAFARTTNRHDYAVKPFAPTVLDSLKAFGLTVAALGKITDIFDGEGITRSSKTVSNHDGMTQLTALLDEEFTGLSFLNLVDFDALYGHRRDAKGYGQAIEQFDADLTVLLPKLRADDLLILTADHGTDPTYAGTDHTRECVPVAVYSPQLSRGGDLGIRDTFADVGATIADNFSLTSPEHGSSFLSLLG